MNKNTLFFEETASLPPPLAREAWGGNMPCGHCVWCPPHRAPLYREGFFSVAYKYYFGTTPLLLQLPTPNSAALPKETDPPYTHTPLGEGKHKVPTGASWSPRAGNY